MKKILKHVQVTELDRLIVRCYFMKSQTHLIHITLKKSFSNLYLQFYPFRSKQALLGHQSHFYGCYDYAYCLSGVNIQNVWRNEQKQILQIFCKQKTAQLSQLSQKSTRAIHHADLHKTVEII